LTLKEGDTVNRGELVALLAPVPLDTRIIQQNQAALEAAEAELNGHNAILKQARIALDQADRELQRAVLLAGENVISRRQLEQAQLDRHNAEQNHENAAFAVRAAGSNVERIRAALNTSSPVRVTAPIQGRVFRVLQQSERVVDAGDALVEMGDPFKIEILFDVLSSDAVTIRAGAEVIVENWGGEETLLGRIRTIEPSAFTKVSPLGIEEQRVRVVADIVDNVSVLGDGYRVEGQIVTWEGAEVLKVPISALFKIGTKWHVFTVVDGRAVQKAVSVGHRNTTEAEVLDGLVEGEHVVLYPSEKLKNGVTVR
jgi:HlyD family secretion protein